MGLQGDLESLELALAKSSDQFLSLALKEKADKLIQEFKLNLCKPGEYLELKEKLARLENVNRRIEVKDKGEKLKAEINEKVPAKVKEKLILLKVAQEKLSKGEEVDKEIVEQVETAMKELEEVLRSSGLEIVAMNKRAPDMKEKFLEVNNEINAEIVRAIDVPGLRGKIEELKMVMGESSNLEKAEKLQEEIKERIVAVMDAESLKEKVEYLRVEMASSTEDALRGKHVADNGRS